MMEGIFNLEVLAEKIRDKKGLLVYFSTESCSVCKVLKPKVAELLQDSFPLMESCYVDTDKSPLISGQHRVFSIPTILLFFQGREQKRFIRNIGLNQLEEAIEKPYHLVFSE